MRRPAGQRVHPIDRCSLGDGFEGRAALQQLPVERQAFQMRAAHQNVDHIGRANRRAVERRLRHTGGAHAQGEGLLYAVANAQQRTILQGNASERDTEGHIVVGDRRRNGHGGHIQQVHKICVKAKLTIAQDRLFEHFFDRKVPSRRGCQQAVQTVELRHAGLFQIMQSVFGFEELSGRRLAARGDDLAHSREHDIGVLFDQRQGREIALGDPRSLVKQLGCLIKRGVIDFDKLKTLCA